MSLKDIAYLEPSLTVNIPSASGSLPVVCYGIGLDALMVLARDYAEQLSPVFQSIREGKLTEAGGTELIVKFLGEIPTLVDLILMFGLKAEDDDLKLVSSFPAGVKVELVEAIAMLTFRSENGSGKAVEIVRRAFSEWLPQKAVQKR